MLLGNVEGRAGPLGPFHPVVARHPERVFAPHRCRGGVGGVHEVDQRCDVQLEPRPQALVDVINEKGNRHVAVTGISDDFLQLKQEKFDVMATNWSVAAVGALLAVLALALSLFALRRLLIALYHPPPVVADFFPLVLIALLPAFKGYSNFVYDYPQLLLFTMGILFIVEQRWRGYYIILVLTLLNKETAVLLPVLFAVTQFDAMERGRLVRHIAAQGVIAAVVLGSLVWMFHDNPGETTEFHLSRNIAYLMDYRNYFCLEAFDECPLAPSGLRIWLPVGLNLPLWLLIGAFVGVGWRDAPTVMKRSLPVILVPLVLLQLFFGFVDEIRVLYEALPVLIALMYAAAARVWRIAPDAPPAPPA